MSGQKGKGSSAKVIPLSPRGENSSKKSPERDEQGTGVSAQITNLLSHSETETILDTILEQAVQSTNADGGSIYFIEQIPQENFGGTRPSFKRVLRFYRAISRSMGESRLKDKWLDLTPKSIAGWVAINGKVVNILDCYAIPAEAPYKFASDLDQMTGYQTKSMLAVPIITRSGEALGVVQLVNKLRYNERRSKIRSTKDTLTFTELDEKLMEALASQAAISLENAKLTQDIEKLFESFIRASVTAIEQRDPSTSGHSDRVAIMTVDFAKAVTRADGGPLGEIAFSTKQIQEIRYASLLHDFGKIGVRENVLLKAKKLYPNELETILLRMDTMKAKNESSVWRQVAEKMAHSPTAADKELAQALWQVDQFNQKLEKVRQGILRANESQVMGSDFDIKSMIEWIIEHSSTMGQVVLNEEEIRRLSIPRGTLDEGERKEIESHVSHTFQFLSQIAWTPDLANVPHIAHGHHEKLDGTGYPLGLRREQIPIQSKMMAISDIFDALTAMDRPYKKALPTERALDILHLEANEGKLDKSLLKVFVDAHVYQGALEFSLKRKAS